MQPLDEANIDILFRETEEAPCQIASLNLIGPSASGETITLAHVLEVLNERVPATAHGRQRLVQAPMQPEQAYWIDDEQFSIQRHVTHHDQSGVRSVNGLLNLSAELAARPLPRDRPLWQVVFFDGLRLKDKPELSAAILVIIHEVLIEDSSGEQVLDWLLDFAPDEQRSIEPRPFNPEPVPGTLEMLGRSPMSLLQVPFRLVGRVKDSAASLFYQLLMERLEKLPFPGRLLRSRPATFNNPVSSARTASNFQCDLQRLQNLKALSPKATLNDVILTLISLVIELWQKQGDSPDTDNNSMTENGAAERRRQNSLIALEPVSVRSTRINTPVGSELTAMLIDLSLEQTVPAGRLEAIHNNALASKIYQQAISASRLRTTAPSAMLGLAARVYGEFQLAQQHKPLFNLPITNIPGPASPLYFGDFPVPDKLGLTPLYNNLGLAVVVISYNGKMNFTLHYCQDLMPPLGELTTLFESAIATLDESLSAGIAPEAAPDRPEDSQPVPAGGLAGLIGDLKRIFQGLARNSLAEALVKKQRQAKAETADTAAADVAPTGKQARDSER
ncbi:MAG: wax ester/triacylglycerol synthase family O-acyltransferase [unclassified Hahellaceae]|nr:wax ester/triacylglycerol synthase family O-acyltransferase [Hahellaceae bacterium]|tara:strand:+ start:2587 stop:4269 length:1683 start_codon:yes stop_codon:yes gene_type:complete